MCTRMFTIGIILVLLLRECTPDDDCWYNCYTVLDFPGGQIYMFSHKCEETETLKTTFYFDRFQKKVRATYEKLNNQEVRLQRGDCENKTTMDNLVQSRQRKDSTLSKSQNMPTNHSSASFADLKMEFFIGTDFGSFTWYHKDKTWVRVHNPMYNMVSDPSHHRIFCADLDSVWSIDVKTIRSEKVCHITEDPTIGIGLDARLGQLFLCVYSGVFYRLDAKKDSKLIRLLTKDRLRSFVVEPRGRCIYASMQRNSHQMFVLTYQGKVIQIHRITQDMTSVKGIDLYEMRIIYKTKGGLFEFKPKENRTSKCVLPSHDGLIQIQYEPKLIATLQRNGRISVYDRDWTKIADIYNPHPFQKAVDFVMIPK